MESICDVDPAGFQEVWAVDFEFSGGPGDRPGPVCLVATELKSGRTIRVFQDELKALRAPPYSTSADALFVAYYASAELGCHLALGWPFPARILDLYVEFRCHTNGKEVPCGRGLVGACTYFGVPHIGIEEKTEMRDLVLTGGPWTAEEAAQILDYCQTDVDALAGLLPKMLPHIDLPRALLRGRYMGAVASMEWAGTPIDTRAHASLVRNWDRIKDAIIEQVDQYFGVFKGQAFKVDNFLEYLGRREISWPFTSSGRPELRDGTFKAMSRVYPELEPLRETRKLLGKLRISDLALGQDGRNRCLLSAFGAKTGRNTPSNSKFIFGPSAWMRGLIRPGAGRGLAYIDWEQQEFGIAAALSGDAAMISAYRSGDPYLAFAKQAGAVPAGGTKETHPKNRDLFKQCVLAVQYGMGAKSLAFRIGSNEAHARRLLEIHHDTYPTFWRWSDAVENTTTFTGEIRSVFGWPLHLGSNVNPRSIRNFPMQANGAEMLRLACCLCTEAGIRVCAPVHDAILVEAPLETLEEAVAEAMGFMAEASEAVLDGFRLRTEAKIVRHPDRYMESRGADFWNRVVKLTGDFGSDGDTSVSGTPERASGPPGTGPYPKES